MFYQSESTTDVCGEIKVLCNIYIRYVTWGLILHLVYKVQRIFCQICQFLRHSFTSELVNYTWSLFSLYFRCKFLAFSWWRGLPALFLSALSRQVQQCVTAHGMCQIMGGEQKGSKFFHQAWSFETSALSKLSSGLRCKCLIPCEALQPIERATDVLLKSAN